MKGNGPMTKLPQETVKQLKNRIDYINSLAYTDKLTDLQNNTAYIQAVSVIKTEIEKLKGTEFLVENVAIKSTLKDDQLAELDNVVITIEKSLGL